MTDYSSSPLDTTLIPRCSVCNARLHLPWSIVENRCRLCRVSPRSSAPFETSKETRDYERHQHAVYHERSHSAFTSH